MSKKFNATESFWYKGSATFASGGETTDWNFQHSVNFSRKTCVIAGSAASV